MKKGNIYLLTGGGWGKTTSALGVALRAVGQKKKVVMIQFMKGRKSVGEYRARSRLAPYFRIFQFGSENFINIKNPSQNDKKLAENGLELAKKIAKERPFLMILDEINIAAAAGLVSKKDVLALLDKIPDSTNVYLTGRYAPKEFIRRADYATKISAVKHPPMSGKGKVGIDY